MNGNDCIEKLYRNFGVLADAKDKIAEHEKEYLEILMAVKGSEKEKRLASQFIARFFKHFPNLADQAIEAQLDLCEDEDVSIRKQATKDLPSLCKDNKEHTQRIADILAQLLQAEDKSELAVVQNSLMTLFKIDAKGSLAGLFAHILNGEDAVRDRCMKFLGGKLKALGHEVVNREAEDYLIAEAKKVLQDVTADEFHILMEVLVWTRLGQSPAGHRELVEIVAEQALGEPDFDPSDDEHVDRLVHSAKHALPYFSSQIDSSKFVVYMCELVLPRLSEVSSADENSDPQLDILKLFAELCTHCTKLPDPTVSVQCVFNTLLSFMPPPPMTDGEEQEEPKLFFSYVECLMYSLHRLARLCPEFLTQDADRLKDFRLRLQYFARGIQGYIKKLREALQGKTGEELKTEENKIKVVALKTTSNINTLIKDLFHSPPSFKSTISLSWKPARLNSNTKDGSHRGGGDAMKRHTPITFGEGGAPDSKQSKQDSRGNRELYQPPGGKYSDKVSQYSPSQLQQRGGRPRGGSGGGRGARLSGGGGGFRGGGSRGWRRGY
ncbi:apoptosis inhibitor 5 [Nilaparvata lugens]|uniref:apoptosis inhibitor 5 n=1 Tax=Nilaparvata lugens TaxID=108931 RepID=UPI00193D53AE|nr:apoptosis inhibitor 5 [Nilaparvata lugens]